MGKIVMLIGTDLSKTISLKDCVLVKDEVANLNIKDLIVHTSSPGILETNHNACFHYSKEELESIHQLKEAIDFVYYNICNSILRHTFALKEEISTDVNYITLASLETYKNFLKSFKKDDLIPIVIKEDEPICRGNVDHEFYEKYKSYSKLMEEYSMYFTSDEIVKDDIEKNVTKLLVNRLGN